MPDDQEIALPVSSSTPPVFCKQQESLFREVIQLLESNHVPFVISGAFALHEHTGIWRDTKDLDLFLPAQEVGRALTLLEKDGFETEVLDSVWLAKAKRDGFFVDLITGMSNAVLRVDYSWIRHASRSEVFGLSVRVLAPEELIASKIFVTRRERFDGADICHVIYGTKGKFDWQTADEPHRRSLGNAVLEPGALPLYLSGKFRLCARGNMEGTGAAIQR